MIEIIKTTFRLRRGYEQDWERENPILDEGEPGYNLTNKKLKIGDGVTYWKDLEYANKCQIEELGLPMVKGGGLDSTCLHTGPIDALSKNQIVAGRYNELDGIYGKAHISHTAFAYFEDTVPIIILEEEPEFDEVKGIFSAKIALIGTIADFTSGQYYILPEQLEGQYYQVGQEVFFDKYRDSTHAYNHYYIDKRRVNEEGKYAFIIGNGTSETKRSNAYTLDWEGNGWYAGGLRAEEINGERITIGANRDQVAKLEDVPHIALIDLFSTNGLANFKVSKADLSSSSQVEISLYSSKKGKFLKPFEVGKEYIVKIDNNEYTIVAEENLFKNSIKGVNVGVIVIPGKPVTGATITTTLPPEDTFTTTKIGSLKTVEYASEFEKETDFGINLSEVVNDNTGEVQYIYDIYLPLDSGMKHSVAIYEKSIQKISEELLPENIVKKEDVPSLNYSEKDEGKILQVINGKPTWVEPISTDEGIIGVPKNEIFVADTAQDFPKNGDEAFIYRAQKEKRLYQWLEEESKYEPLTSKEPVYNQFLSLLLKVLENGLYSSDQSINFNNLKKILDNIKNDPLEDPNFKLATPIIQAIEFHEYVDTITEPTCTERGYTAHTCSDCGDSYVDNYVAKLGHEYGDYIETNTDGLTSRECSRCNGQEFYGTYNLTAKVELDDSMDAEAVWDTLYRGKIGYIYYYPKENAVDGYGAANGYASWYYNPDYDDEPVEKVFVDKKAVLGTHSYYMNNFSDFYIDGYEMTPIVRTWYEGEEPTEESRIGSITLTKEKPIGYIMLIIRYTKYKKLYFIGDTVWGPDDVSLIRSLYPAPYNGDWVKVLDENDQPTINEDGDFLWIIEEVKNGSLTVTLEFENNIIPEGIENFEVKITSPNEDYQTFNVNTQNSEIKINNLPMGSYTVEELVNNIKPDDYNLFVKYTAYLEGEVPMMGNTITLTKENPTGHIIIVNRYGKIETDHTHEYISIVTEPTCTEMGYTTHVCECADNYIDSYVNELGHDWGDQVRYDNGLKIRECSVCKEVDKRGSLYGYLYVESNTDEDVKSLIKDKSITIKYKRQNYSGSTSSRTMSARDGTEFVMNDDLTKHYISDVDTSKVQLDGYDLTVKYMAGYEGEELFESNSLTLTEKNPVGRINIILSYTAIKD